TGSRRPAGRRARRRSGRSGCGRQVRGRECPWECRPAPVAELIAGTHGSARNNARFGGQGSGLVAGLLVAATVAAVRTRGTVVAGATGGVTGVGLAQLDQLAGDPGGLQRV